MNNLNKDYPEVYHLLYELYQVLGNMDAPENVLDNVSDAIGGRKLRHSTLLPFWQDLTTGEFRTYVKKDGEWV